MPRSRTETVLVLLAAAVGLVLTFVVGLFAYISLTATPLHPDVQKVPSVTRSAPPPGWAGAAESGRQFARAGVRRADRLRSRLDGRDGSARGGTHANGEPWHES